MATTITLKAQNFCVAGNHFDLVATGDISFTAQFEVSEFAAPLTEEEKANFLRMLVRFARVTRTDTQVKTALTSQQGVTVSI